jgi:hypothetical protein
VPAAADGRVPAFYSAGIDDFLGTSDPTVVGYLSSRHVHADIDTRQVAAWTEQLQILRGALVGLTGTVFLEFEVPRLGSRIDAVVVAGPAVFPIEFKCGEQQFTVAAHNQAWDYALDLKNFHLASHAVPVLPILVATGATRSDESWLPMHADGSRPPRHCAPGGLARAIADGIALSPGPDISGVPWGRSAYQPTPTIVEAARALYSRHTVDAITRNDAGARNLSVTSTAVEEIIDRAKHEGRKAIVFVTGVPGAGKTLVGLDVATRRRDHGAGRAVFLSGNGPLVAVLREALVRDECRRVGTAARKGAVRQKVKPFIQNVHHFRDEGVRTAAAPYDHVVIFDEAQRAWDHAKTASFMKRRKGIPEFAYSEPAFLISYLDRHPGWAVIVCLVGGGQEIHDGEAGISEWLTAIVERFPNWQAYVSPHLTDSEYAADGALQSARAGRRVLDDDRLHLATSMRSFRSERVSAFVKALLDCDAASAQTLATEVSKTYPMVVTRSLAMARSWLRAQARGNERVGLVASSQALRLKPHAIDLRVSVDPVHWFLADRDDTRSSDYLEDAATEFQIQGLEVDWACVAWDADLRFHRRGWRHHSFRGARWESIKKDARKRYQLNAYRVLLTRARQGMAIFIPPGDASDPTREPSFYDDTFNYLVSLGLPAM